MMYVIVIAVYNGHVFMLTLLRSDTTNKSPQEGNPTFHSSNILQQNYSLSAGSMRL